MQLHTRKTPLADDVNFTELAEKYAVAGGDIKNAVLKAAQMASAELGPDAEKKIHQRHFIAGIEDVLSSKRVMEQSIVDGDGSARPQFDPGMMQGISQAFSQLAQNQNAMAEDLTAVIEKSQFFEEQLGALPDLFSRFESVQSEARGELRSEIVDRLDGLKSDFAGWRSGLDNSLNQIKSEQIRLEERGNAAADQFKILLGVSLIGLLCGIGAIITAILH